MYYVYILKSLKDNNKYIGSTNNLQRRIKEHNDGKVLSTKNRRPLILIYKEKYDNETEARRKEMFYKTYNGFKELKDKLSGYSAVG